ncbi:hypothetical protein [Archaeoglobus sp.]
MLTSKFEEEFVAIIKKINEIQGLLKVIANRTADDYLRVEILTLYNDFGELAEKFVSAFRKSSSSRHPEMVGEERRW